MMTDSTPTALDRLGWAMRAPIDDATTWRVLMRLTDHADASGLAFPRITTLAGEVRRGEQAARLALNTLERDGYVARVRLRSGGRLRGYLFRVLVPGSAPVDPDLLPAFTAGVDLPPDWTQPVPTGDARPVEGASGDARGDTSGDRSRVASGDGSRVVYPPPVTGQEPPSSEPPSGEPPSGNLTPSSTASTNGTPAPVDPTVDDPLHGFEDTWQVYPKRNGKRVGKSTAQQRWKWLTYEERKEVYRAVLNYRAACEAGKAGAMDMLRFIAKREHVPLSQHDRFWRDWLEPADLTPPQRAGSTDAEYRAAFERMATRQATGGDGEG